MYNSAAEGIWGMTLSGFRKGLEEADALARDGQMLAAEIRRASLYYSYRFIPGFFKKAVACMKRARRECGDSPANLSHGQCDVVGTIAFRSGDLEGAKKYFRAGLAKKPIPHSEALLRMGLAEVAHAQGDAQHRFQQMDRAMVLRSGVEKEENRTQALRQFSRVLRRSAMLWDEIGNPVLARQCYEHALALAHDPVVGSRSQRFKLFIAWHIFRRVL